MKLPSALPVAGLLLFALAGTALGQKTDVIVLFNGNWLTGEIKSYASGRLSVSTDVTSDVSVKWNKIVSITSDKQFEIETTDGRYHYGTLAPSTLPGKLDVVSGGKVETIEFIDVVRLAPLYATFWRRIKGSLDLGFNYTQANQFVQFNLNANATVRKPTFATSASVNAFFSSQQGVTSSQRANFSVGYQKFLKDRWLLGGSLGFDRNQDLGLDLRLSAAADVGRDVIQTNQSSLTVLGGLSGNRETPVAGTASYNLEAVLGAQYAGFTYDFPKVTVGGSLQVFPSLTDLGRVRLEFQAQAKREIVRDFYVSLSLFDSFDSRDPTTLQPRNDWGPVLAIGWTF